MVQDALTLSLQRGEYPAILGHFSQHPPADPAERRIYGLALLRSGDLQAALSPLSQSADQGDFEASVELGNLHRALGHFDLACKQFDRIQHDVHGELYYRLLRWWGVTEFQTGQVQSGLQRCEEAWRGYMAMGDALGTERITTTLATMYLDLGEVQRAQALYKAALKNLPDLPYPDARYTALHGMANVHLRQWQTSAFEALIPELRRVAALTNSALSRAHVSSLEVAGLIQRGQRHRATDQLWSLFESLDELRDSELHHWVTATLADLLSRSGQVKQAQWVLQHHRDEHDDLLGYPLIRGIIHLRQGELLQAQEALEQARAEAQHTSPTGFIRAGLHLAEVWRLQADYEQALAMLQGALSALLDCPERQTLSLDLLDLPELCGLAQLDPTTAPLLASITSELHALPDRDAVFHGQRHILELHTLTDQHKGQLFLDGERIPFRHSQLVAMLAYISQHPGAQSAVICQALQTTDNDDDFDLAQVVDEARELLGKDVLWQNRQAGMRLNPEYKITLDVDEFGRAVNQQNLLRAISIYHADFLVGLSGHYVNQTRASLGAQLIDLHLQGIKGAESAGQFAYGLRICNRLLALPGVPNIGDLLEDRLRLAEKCTGLATEDLLTYRQALTFYRV